MSFRDKMLTKITLICVYLLLVTRQVNGALDLLTAVGSD